MEPVARLTTIVFEDIAGSADAKQRVGDAAFFRLLTQHHSVVRSAIAAHGGVELKTVGDAFLIAFDHPARAIHCAIQIQQHLSTTPIGEPPLRVRVGIHTGSPLTYRDRVSGATDLSGTDVDKAARIQALAVPGQILMSEQTRLLVERQDSHDWGIWDLKGLGRHRIFEVLWGGKGGVQPAGRPWLQTSQFATSFIGRTRDLAEIRDATEKHRLVTLVGVGGVGKTRLADEVAMQLTPFFDDGSVFVPLSEAENTERAVALELSSALRAKTEGFTSSESAVEAHLRDRSALVVLDGFEIVTAASPFIQRLLSIAPRIHFLITSQRSLGLPSEQRIEVRPLSLPSSSATLATSDSYGLFCERARLRRPDWKVSDDSLAVLTEILRLTEGLPLSIELAAARVDTVPLAAIRDALEQARFEFLRSTSGIADTPRHRSLQACLDWSFSLLTEPEKHLFVSLSVFAEAAFASDIAAVSGIDEAAPLLIALSSASLISWDEVFELSRYRMLSSVREYAFARLHADVQAQLQYRHSLHFLVALGELDRRVQSTDEQRTGLARITIDLGNFRAGMDTASRLGEKRMVVQYAARMHAYLSTTGRSQELVARTQSGLAAAEALNEPIATARALHLMGLAYAEQPTGPVSSQVHQAIECLEKALQTFVELDARDESAYVHDALGAAYLRLPAVDMTGNIRRAINHFDTALQALEERSNPVAWATTRNHLGMAYADLSRSTGDSDLRIAIEHFEATLRVVTEAGTPSQWAKSNNNLAVCHVELRNGDHLQKAVEYYQAALRVQTEGDFPVDWATTQVNLGTTYLRLADGRNEQYLELGLRCISDAFRVLTPSSFPKLWGKAQTSLGTTYANLKTGDDLENQRRAIVFYTAALTVQTPEEWPMEWAITQSNLGRTFAQLPDGNRESNIVRAIQHFEDALRALSEVHSPALWAMTQQDLGTTWIHKPSGDHVANRRRAIECLESALRGYEACGLTEKADEVRRVLKLQRLFVYMAEVKRRMRQLCSPWASKQ